MSVVQVSGGLQLDPGSRFLPDDASTPILYFQDHTKLMRGVHLFSPFAQGATTGGHYNANPFPGTFDSRMPTARRDVIKAAGFDVVRYDVGSAILMDAYVTGGDSALDARITTMVRDPITAYRGSGLKVLVNIFPHFGGGGSGDIDAYSYVNLFGDGPAGTRWSLFVYCVGKVAAAIEAINKPHEVALELFNEVPASFNIAGGNWYDDYLPLLYAECRAQAPKTTLFFQGTSFGSMGGGIPTANDGVSKLTLSRFDVNCVISGHSYDITHHFNHQHAGGEFDQMRGLVWPAASHPGGLTAAKATWLAQADADLAAAVITTGTYNSRKADIHDSTAHSSSLHRYFNEFGAKTGLTRSLDVRLALATTPIAARGGGWTNKNFAMTEGGVRWDVTGAAGQGATAASAAQWTQDWYDLMEAAGCNMYIAHTINGVSSISAGDTFGIQSGVTPYGWNSWILSALRLT